MAWRDIKGWPVTRLHFHWYASCPLTGLQTRGWKPAPKGRCVLRLGMLSPQWSNWCFLKASSYPGQGPALPPQLLPTQPRDPPTQACTHRTPSPH